MGNNRVPQWLRNDRFYQECLALAQQSKSAAERYGAIVVRENEIVGTGYNRFVGMRNGVRPPRRIRQGYANHAEIEALNAALEHSEHLKGAALYVGGYFATNDELDIRHNPVFTCVRCLPHLYTHGIVSIHTPTYRGWGMLTLEEAQQGAEEFRTKQHGESLLERRLAIGESHIPLSRVL